MSEMIIRVVAALFWTTLTYFTCKKVDGSNEAIVGLWKTFMVMVSVASWILLILAVTGTIK